MLMLLPNPRRTVTATCLLLCCLTLPALGKEHKVTIDELKYSPNSLKVKKGDTVVWTNGDDRDHTVTADDGTFASKNMGRAATFQHKFTKAGRFKYHCDYHPRMKATVVVEE